MASFAPSEEPDWIRRSQKGDHEAFEALIAEYQQMIHSLTFRMTGSLQDAEDLSQETFIHAFQHLEAYRGESKFSSWLYRIAINLCLNWKKSSERQQRLVSAWSQEQSNDTPDQRRMHEVQEALLKLKAKQRAAIVLTIFDGLSHGKAAKVLGCSETTVSWRVFSAKAKLKRFLKNTPAQGEGT